MPFGLRVRAQRLGDLDAEFARRRQHERLDVRVGGVHELDHGEAEGGGLAGAGLRLADHVVALEKMRDRLFLDGARRVVAHFGEGGEDVLG